MFESKSNIADFFADKVDFSSIEILFVFSVFKVVVAFGIAVKPEPFESIFCLKFVSVLTANWTFSLALTSAPFLSSISLDCFIVLVNLTSFAATNPYDAPLYSTQLSSLAFLTLDRAFIIRFLAEILELSTDIFVPEP